MYWTEILDGKLRYRFLNHDYYMYNLHNIILREELLLNLTLYMKSKDISNDVPTKDILIEEFSNDPSEIRKFIRTSLRKIVGTSSHAKMLRK
jgi:hypothetical protein